MKEVLYVLEDVVHTLQRERGCAAIFLYSKGELFLERMLFQFRGSDKALLTFQEAVGRWKTDKDISPGDMEKLVALAELCSELPTRRADITSKKTTVADAISHYSHTLISPIIQIMVTVALHMEDSNSVSVSAYNTFLQWKERIGLERAIGARGFVNNNFQDTEFAERVTFLLSEQANYKNTFYALASKDQQKSVREVLDIDEVGMLACVHEGLKKSPDNILEYNLTPKSWYDLVSAKIDALHKVHGDLVDSLTNHNHIDEMDQYGPAETIQAISDRYWPLVSSLQLFSGISHRDLHTLLQSAQTREFEKGKLIFLEGEPANRLYIVLKGWVKAFTGTIHGEETILQMLSSGDAILESAVFLNTPFPVSCQVVEDATLLSIPSPVLRQQVKNNNELALNLLATMSHRSQGLIRQIERARLKSVDERVGWFLLKLLLDQDHVSRCIELPYDKSLIASYLDMKRETFSRALQRMKAKGFKIENDVVVIPELTSLCGFCDPSLAKDCVRHGLDCCPNPQLDEHPEPVPNPAARQKNNLKI